MNDQELETRLRTRYSARAREAEAAPLSLRRDVAVIPRSATPRRRLLGRGRGVTLLAAAALLLVGGALAAGSGLLRLPTVVPPVPAPVPAPYGVARNGYIAAAQDGDIVLLDPGSGRGTTIIGGPALDLSPRFSRDGTRLAFSRERSSNVDDFGVWVADADGRNQVELAADGLINAHVIDWSPDGRSLTVGAVAEHEAGGGTWILPTDGSPGRKLDIGMPARYGLWRPVDGREILITGGFEKDVGLFAVRPDGSGLRPVTASQSFVDTMKPYGAWSPDGTQVAYNWPDSDGVQRIHVVPADGGTPRAITSDVTIGPVWSPDGTLIAAKITSFGRIPERERIIIVRADGSGQPVFGPALDVDVNFTFTWAPDGTKILIGPDLGGRALLLDPLTGATVQTSWSAPHADWQRRAP